MHSHLQLVTFLLASFNNQEAHSAVPKERDRPKMNSGMMTKDSPICPPAAQPPPPGGQDTPCSVHSACSKGLICALSKDLAKGSCNKVNCGASSECKGATALPARCLGGSCVEKDCYTDSDCPSGYGCFDGLGGNQCKKVANFHGNSWFYRCLTRTLERVRQIVTVLHVVIQSVLM